uniref:BZIP domain-containing protein n=1 Tax=Biomphalaria glabrata TaxID=6526 RepID=A0A2C9LPH4_BIOGL
MNVLIGTDLNLLECDDLQQKLQVLPARTVDVGGHDTFYDSSKAVQNEDLLNNGSLTFDEDFETEPFNSISVSDLSFNSAGDFNEPPFWEQPTDSMIMIDRYRSSNNADKFSFVAVSPETDLSLSESDLDQSAVCKKSCRRSARSSSGHSGYNSVKLFSRNDKPYHFSHMKHSTSIRSKNHWGDSNSKNAIAARDNRLKKKQYIAGLEESLNVYRTENQQLLEENKKNKKTMQELKKEVIYLKSVIANQSTLAAILKNVAKTPGINLSSSFQYVKSGNNPASDSKNVSAEIVNDIFKVTVNSVTNESVPKCSRNLRSSKPRLLDTLSKIPQQDFKRKHNGTKVPVTSKQKKCNLSSDYISQCETLINVEDTDSDSSLETEHSSESSNVGICLHVSGNNVSLELCSKCNARALSEIMIDHAYVKN